MPALAPRVAARPAIAPICCAGSSQRARLLRAVVLRAAVRRRRHAGRLSPTEPAAADAPLPVRKAALQDDRGGRSAGDEHLHARHRVRIALPRRSRPRLREPVPLLLGRLQLPAGPRVSDRPHPAARRSGARVTRAAPGWCRSRSATTRTSSASWRGCIEMGYAISPASLRLDDLTEPIVRLLRESGERTITIAPETGSDRLRRVINKTVTNDEILDRAELIFASGIENLKLYYMIGLPTETDDDLVAIRDLTLQMRERMLKHARSRGQIGRIVGSVNPLIPKPGTAYQWLPMEDPAVDRPEDQAAAHADGRHRQRLLQHQVGAALLLPGAALARRPPRRAGDRSRRAQRPELARRRRRSGRRRRLLHLPRPHAATRSCPGTSSTAA